MNFLQRTFGTFHSPRRQARHLDPQVRQSLRDAVAHETAEGTDALREVQAELLQAHEQFTVIQEREQFLGIRTRQYRKALDEQMVLLQAERERLAAARNNKEQRVVNEEEEEKRPDTLDEDPEQQQQRQRRLNTEELEQAEAAWHRRMEKWQADEQTLLSIIETHKVILSSCETMRRSILVLQEKEKNILKLRGDCEEFLETAAALGQEGEQNRHSEQLVNDNIPNAQDDASERNGSRHNADSFGADERSCTSEDGHLEDVAV